MLRTLYAKLAAVLVLLLVVIGAVYLALSVSATHLYMQEVNQRVSRDLAANLVMDRDLVAEGRLNETALKETFHQYMTINPSIEIYLLDLGGTILAYSADPGKVKRKKVALAPIHRFLQGETFPVLGDDPRSHNKRKAFSVTQVPTAQRPEGYLYVVLQGEEFEAVNRAAQENYFLRLSAWALAGSLLFGLLAGLLLFHLLTRRLRRLACVMEDFRASDFTRHTSYRAGDKTAGNDEIEKLGIHFDEMAARIVAQLDELTKKDNMRRELVAQVSHDLRTPLASLHGYIETLQLKDKTLTPQEREEYLSIALRHSERLSRLVAELFELAKLDANDHLVQTEPFAMAELAHDVVQKYALKARNNGLQVSVEADETIPFVDADIGLIERALENLLENAFNHTPAGGRVTVSLHADNSQLALTVADTGRGIAKADLPRVFERFYQAENSHRGSDHSGLGLAIVKRIIQLHNGEISVTSRQGEGAAFTVVLPAWQGDNR